MSRYPWQTATGPPAATNVVNVAPVRPHRCPVCVGRGTLPPDFYTQIGAGTSTERVQCRSCYGRGVIFA